MDVADFTKDVKLAHLGCPVLCFVSALTLPHPTTITADTKWTILAPNNAAFEKTLGKLNLTADALLKNKALLVKVLSYHVIPSGAVLSSQLKNNTEVATALQGECTIVLQHSPAECLHPQRLYVPHDSDWDSLPEAGPLFQILCVCWPVMSLKMSQSSSGLQNFARLEMVASCASVLAQCR